MSEVLNLYPFKNPAPDMTKWKLGRKYFLEGITHWNHIKTAINAVHYYAWFGDLDQGVERMSATENDLERHGFFMRVLDRCKKSLELTSRLYKKVEQWSRSACHWRKGVSVEERQQVSNKSRHSEAATRIVEVFNLIVEKTGNVPSINQIANKAKANWHTVKNILKEKGLLGSELKAGPVVRHSSPNEADQSVSSFRTKTFKEKDQNNRDDQRSEKSPAAQPLASLLAKLKMPMPWRPISAYEAGIHANGSCYLEKDPCRICAKAVSNLSEQKLALV